MKRLVLGAVAAVFLAASVPSAQTRPYKAPRTPDGHRPPAQLRRSCA